MQGSKLQCLKQKGGLSEWEDKDEIPLPQLQEGLKNEEMPVVETESNEEVQGSNLKPLKQKENMNEQEEKNEIPLSQLWERLRDKKGLKIEP